MKRFEVLFTRHAEADFDDIADFIAADNPHTALNFVTALHDRTVAFLSVTPNAVRASGTSVLPFLDGMLLSIASMMMLGS